MAINPFFHTYKNNSNEQTVLDSLINESINIYGIEVYYLPRHDLDPDKLYGTSTIVEFSDYYPIPMYLDRVDGFNDASNIFSKFGLQIEDQITYVVSSTNFMTLVGNAAGIPRPREGDLLYDPLTKKCYEITFVNNKQAFYPMGILLTYAITAKVYQYSSEKFNTGIPEIDRLDDFSLDVFEHTLMTEDGKYLMTEDGKYLTIDNYAVDYQREVNDDSKVVETESETFINFSEDNPFSEKF